MKSLPNRECDICGMQTERENMSTYYIRKISSGNVSEERVRICGSCENAIHRLCEERKLKLTDNTLTAEK